MPSFWDLLCVSRQKYATHHQPPIKSTAYRKWEGPKSFGDQSDFEHRNQPQYREAGPRREKAWSNYEDPVSHSDPMVEVESDREHSPYFNEENFPQNTRMHQRREGEGDRPHPLFDSSNQDSVWSNQSEDDGNNRKDGRRRHVQDIFKFKDKSDRSNENVGRASYDGSHSTSTPDTADRSGARSHGDHQEMYTTSMHKPRHDKKASSRNTTGTTNSSTSSSSKVDNGKRTESMYQYTPRSVNDNDASAVLFGGRPDDFIHNPDWNRNIHHFANSPATSPTSPASTYQKFFSETNSPPPPTSPGSVTGSKHSSHKPPTTLPTPSRKPGDTDVNSGTRLPVENNRDFPITPQTSSGRWGVPESSSTDSFQPRKSRLPSGELEESTVVVVLSDSPRSPRRNTFQEDDTRGKRRDWEPSPSHPVTSSSLPVNVKVEENVNHYVHKGGVDGDVNSSGYTSSTDAAVHNAGEERDRRIHNAERESDQRSHDTGEVRDQTTHGLHSPYIQFGGGRVTVETLFSSEEGDVLY